MTEYDYRFGAGGQIMEISGKKVVVAIVAFAAVLATIALVGKPVVRLRPESPTPRPSLAVLPFDNLDGADELERVAADVTVSVTDALAELSELTVVPRAQTLEYRGIPGGARAIAEALGVDYVLAGSIERDDGRLRLQAYFVKPGDRPRIWADEFYYDEADMERIPTDMARRIRDALARTAAEE